MSMTLRQRIDIKMNVLQHWMETNYHLVDQKRVSEHALSIGKFWSVLSEEDKDYVQVAQDAIEEKRKWKID